jgi:hypothetical protein
MKDAMKHYILNQKHETVYGWQNKPATFRKGAKVIPATNLDKGGFWVQSRAVGLSRNIEFTSWQDVYGIWVSGDKVKAV